MGLSMAVVCRLQSHQSLSEVAVATPMLASRALALLFLHQKLVTLLQQPALVAAFAL
jgi:hypothetical protein